MHTYPQDTRHPLPTTNYTHPTTHRPHYAHTYTSLLHIRMHTYTIHTQPTSHKHTSRHTHIHTFPLLFTFPIPTCTHTSNFTHAHKTIDVFYPIFYNVDDNFLYTLSLIVRACFSLLILPVQISFLSILSLRRSLSSIRLITSLLLRL